MKKVRIGLTLFLAVMVCLAWFAHLNAESDIANKYTEDLAAAENFFAEKLYQKAIDSYENALKVKEDFTTRYKLLDSYLASYIDGTSSQKDYERALESACLIYPESEELWERLIDIKMSSLDYVGAFSSLKKALNSGVDGERIGALKKELLYSYTPSRTVFTGYSQSPYGSIAVFNSDYWLLYSGGASSQEEIEFEYIGPLNREGSAVYRTEADTRFIDGEGVVQAFIAENFVEARPEGDGFIPVKKGTSWAYLSVESGQIVSPSYEDASAFFGGLAAVKQAGAWMLIDTEFKAVSEKRFADIKLFSNGEFMYKNVMVAKESSAYTLYSNKIEPIDGLFARDMDNYYGDMIAFRGDSGTWGFADKDGNVIISPQFNSAKSFSNGLAAVSNGELWGFINRDGELVMDYQFLEAGYFTEEGSCFVSTTEGVYLIITLRFPRGL